MSALTRRRLLAGAGIAAACCAGGCATYGTPRQTPSNPDPSTPAPEPPAPPGPPAGPAQASPAGIAAATDVPVGGGRVFAAEGVVVTQPRPGAFAAFDSACTHAGCLVDQVTATGIACPCHGSVFGIDDGAPVAGPAAEPLAPRDVRVESGRIVLT